MSITVRLIFWGLVGFAPNPEGEKGMTALLVDPPQGQASEKSHSVPRHLSAIYLLKGECTGDCARIPDGHEKKAELMGFTIKDGKPVARDRLHLGLAWLLDREELDLSGDEDEKFKHQKPLIDFSSNIAPTKENHGSYFKWVQNLDSLIEGSGRVRNDCIYGESTCPLHGLFRIQGGRTSTCHLFHDPERDSFESNERDIRLITYIKPNGKRFRRAVADAVLVEFTEEGEFLTLTSQGLPEQNRQCAEARIKPDAQGDLTLVVVNFPIPGHPIAPEPHSDFLYSLLDQEPISRTMRDDTILKTTPGLPGSCELEAIRLESLFGRNKWIREAPHSTTACDNVYFQP